MLGGIERGAFSLKEYFWVGEGQQTFVLGVVCDVGIGGEALDEISIVGRWNVGSVQRAEAGVPGR